MTLVSMKRGDPTLYYGTKQLYFRCVNFKITGGGNHPFEDVLQKKKKKKKKQPKQNKQTKKAQEDED